MRSYRRQATVIVAVVAAIVFASAATFIIWNDETDDPDESDDLLAGARATLTARSDTSASVNPSPSTTTGDERQAPTYSGVCESSTSRDALPATVGSGGLFDVWYGENALWVAPVPISPSDGVVETESAASWYAGGPVQMVWVGSDDPVDVRGVQLDGNSTLDVIASQFQGARTYLTTVVMPESGCWQITGEVAETSLSIVIEVAPISERPDFVAAREARDMHMPWTPPSTCSTTPWEIQDRSPQDPAQWWADSGDLALGDMDGVLWQGNNSVMWSTGIFTERGYDFAV